MKIWKIALVLAIIAGLSGLLISTVNYLTEDKIAENELKKKNELVEEFFEGIDTSTIKWEEVEKYDSVDEKAIIENKGIVYVASGTNGYGDISLVLAADNYNKIIGVKYLKLNQTPGFGDKVNTDDYKGKYKDLDLSEIANGKDGVDAVSGATFSSNLVTDIVESIALAHMDLEPAEEEATEVPLYWFGILATVVIGGGILVWKVGGLSGRSKKQD